MFINDSKVITDYIESECAYHPNLRSTTEYNIISRPTIDMAEDYLDQGWRRFGKMFFRPNCPSCSKCIPLRVNIANFKLSRSMRKALSKNKHIRVEVGPPSCSAEHVNLHNIYHEHQNKVKNWPSHHITETEYRILFCEPMTFAKEFRYFDSDNKLVGLGYVDTLPSAYSSLYFFYDPTWAPLSPGIFSILTEIHHACKNKAKQYHLGYFVKDCSSMDYKLRFSPFDLLMGDDNIWDWPEASWKNTEQ